MGKILHVELRLNEKVRYWEYKIPLSEQPSKRQWQKTNNGVTVLLRGFQHANWEANGGESPMNPNRVDNTPLAGPIFAVGDIHSKLVTGPICHCVECLEYLEILERKARRREGLPRSNLPGDPRDGCLLSREDWQATPEGQLWLQEKAKKAKEAKQAAVKTPATRMFITRELPDGNLAEVEVKSAPVMNTFQREVVKDLTKKFGNADFAIEMTPVEDNIEVVAIDTEIIPKNVKHLKREYVKWLDPDATGSPDPTNYTVHTLDLFEGGWVKVAEVVDGYVNYEGQPDRIVLSGGIWEVFEKAVSEGGEDYTFHLERLPARREVCRESLFNYDTGDEVVAILYEPRDYLEVYTPDSDYICGGRLVRILRGEDKVEFGIRDEASGWAELKTFIKNSETKDRIRLAGQSSEEAAEAAKAILAALPGS
jgi:hypothetical protein